MLNLIAPKSGVSLVLRKGESLRVVCPDGGQVSDLFCFNLHDHSESLSSSVSMDEAQKIFLSTNDLLLSNRRNSMLKIIKDTNGRNDFLLPPCTQAENGHVGCFENLTGAFLSYDIGADRVGTAFNLFMKVEVGHKGELIIRPSEAKVNDEIVFVAEMDLLVGLTACAHLQTNGGSLRPIKWEITQKNQ